MRDQIEPKTGNRSTPTYATRGLQRFWLRAAYPAGFAVLFLLSLASVPTASAQISPGPLSRPHQSLNGATNCASCHKFGGQAALKCLDCHTEIAARLSAHKGLHATYNIPAGSSQECARCHSEHNGEDFPLIKWDVKTFNHKETGYTLEGKHAGLACNRCHNAAHISAAERPAIKIKDLSRTYLGLSTGMRGLSRRSAQRTAGPDLSAVPQFRRLEENQRRAVRSLEDALSTDRVARPGACAKCHTNGPDGKPQYTGIPFNQCSDCHKDPHHGSFPQGCQSCHNTSGWKKVSLQARERALRPLQDKVPAPGQTRHRRLRAVPRGRRFQETIPSSSAWIATNTSHNGQFAKRAGGGECSSCHTVKDGSPHCSP